VGVELVSFAEAALGEVARGDGGMTGAFGEGALAPRNRFSVKLALFLIAFLFWPALLWADAGTPFLVGMMVGHLWIGNAIIGIGEGCLLARVFRVRLRRAILLMIGANFASMIGGLVILFGHGGGLLRLVSHEPPLYVAAKALWVLVGVFVAVSFLLSFLIEWPFCLVAVWRTTGKWWKSFAASGLAQAASYAVLIPFYVHMSGVGLFTQVDVDPAFVSSVTDEGWVYFLSTENGDVYRIRLNGTGQERVFPLGLTEPLSRLIVRRSEDRRHVDLLWIKEEGRDVKEGLLLKHAGVIPDPEGYEEWIEQEWTAKAGGDDWRAYDLRPAIERDWDVETTQLGWAVIYAKRTYTGELLRLSLETPFLMWSGRSATVLPGDKVVFQLIDLGSHLPDQLILLDLRARKLGFLTYGRGPVVLLPDHAPGASAEDLPAN
jgi:hypothetical protein